jgi:hypothetical protein
MGRKVAIPWHAGFSIVAGVLYFYFVLPRWGELMGETSHGVGTTMRIVTGALIGLAALPVVFTLLRTRKPELGTPQLALSLRTWSIVGHVLAGVLIIGTAISEIWFSLDKAGQWLFGIYGAAAAIALLGIFVFYLSFVAELPPPPPKPIKPKQPKQRRVRGRKKNAESEALDTEEDTEEDNDDVEDAEEADEAADEAQETEEAEEAESEEPAEQTVEAEAEEAASAESESEPEAEPEAEAEAEAEAEPEAEAEAEPEAEAEEPQGGLRNRRPTGKASHRLRRRTRGGVALDE